MIKVTFLNHEWLCLSRTCVIICLSFPLNIDNFLQTGGLAAKLSTSSLMSWYRLAIERHRTFRSAGKPLGEDFNQRFHRSPVSHNVFRLLLKQKWQSSDLEARRTLKVIQAEHHVGLNTVNIRVTADQVKDSFLGEIMSSGSVVEIDVVDVGDLVMRKDVQDLAHVLEVWGQSVVFNQNHRKFVWNRSVWTLDRTQAMLEVKSARRNFWILPGGSIERQDLTYVSEDPWAR